MREVESTIKTLGNRAVSWRTSHEELLSDYNHCRRTLDFMVHTILCGLLHLDPSTGTSGKQFFRSAWLVTTDEPLANGLHYKPATMCVSSSIMSDRKNRCTIDMAMILKDQARYSDGQQVRPSSNDGLIQRQDLGFRLTPHWLFFC
jgi:hypothetical protein